MIVISVIFYDRENEQFYHAMKPYEANHKIIREWLEYHIKNYDIQDYLSYIYMSEGYEGIYEGCPCIDLLKEMHKQDFYHCNFENFDYVIEEYEL